MTASNIYASVAISGYNASPPPDDGSQTSANEITWAKHKTKLADPVKTLAEAVNTAMVTAGALAVHNGNDQDNVLGGSLAFTPSELTIATGSITPTRHHHTVDTESDAASDDLDTMVATLTAGAEVLLRAENTARTVVIKHGTGNIFMADGQDFSLDTTEQRICFHRVGANWYELYRGPAGRIIKTAYAADGAVATGTTTIPADDTIPQITEGDQYMSLAYTPEYATSELEIEVIANAAQSSAGHIYIIMALFVDTTANALAAVPGSSENAARFCNLSLRHRLSAASTTARTYRVRMGGSSAATITFNGHTSGRIFGGVMSSSIHIKEIVP